MKTYSRRRFDENKKTNPELSARLENLGTHFPFPIVEDDVEHFEFDAGGEGELLEGKIKLMLWNAGGLTNKFDRLMEYMKKHGIHFAVVVETWWRLDGSIPQQCTLNAICPSDNVVKFSGKNGISVVRNPDFATVNWLDSLTCLAKDTVFGCFLSFSLAGVQFAALYRAPSLPWSIEELLDNMTLASRLDLTLPTVILGDFNAKLREWNDSSDNDDGALLKAWMDSRGLARICSGRSPTFDNGRGSSIVDHVFSNVGAVKVVNVGKPLPLVDHAALVVTVPFAKYKLKRVDVVYNRILFEKLHDPDIRNQYHLKTERTCHVLADAVRLLDESRCLETLDKVDKIFCKFFTDAGAAVLGRKKAGKRVCPFKALESPLLRRLYLEQEFAPSAENNLLIANELGRLRRERFAEFTNEVNQKPARDVLKIVSQINSNRKLRQFALQENPLALQEYAEHFRKMNTNSLPAVDYDDFNLVFDSVAAKERAVEIFSGGDLLGTLSSVPWNKAAGASGVSYDLLKAASFNALVHVADWFRLCYEIGLVPSSWTRSLVVPVPKKGDLSMIKNYRPISLTESFRKLYEHSLRKYILRSFEPNHFTQGGFRSHHCVNDMVIALHQVLSTRKNVHVAFLDIRAAYDSVDRELLWRKCRKRGMSDDLIWSLRRLFDHNSSQLVIAGKRSQPFPIKAGVLQGSVLSPTLYALFIDDLAAELNRHNAFTIGGCRLNATFYADDVAVFSQSKEGLQLLLAVCAAHARRNRYQFNVAKCAVIGDREFEYRIDGEAIPHVDTFTYLGVETNRNGIVKDGFVARRCKGAIDAGLRLSSMGMNVGGFSVRNSVLLYKTFIRSKLEACLGILPQASWMTRKLEAAQRTVLARIFFCSPNTSGVILRSLTNCPSMAFRTRYLRSRYVQRVLNLPLTHVLRRQQSAERWYVDCLRKDNFTSQELKADKADLIAADMNATHALTKIATGGFLDLVDSVGLPWFVTSKLIGGSLRKRLLQWVLKKFPACKPPYCGRCLLGLCTQSHIADCSQLLFDLAPDIPARFRPEFLISKPTDLLPEIANAVNEAIGSCLPFARLRIAY